MILLAAAGSKLFINPTDLPGDDFVLWQEHAQILVSSPTKVEPYVSLKYEVAWRQPDDRTLSGALSSDGKEFGTWKAAALEDRVSLDFTVTNMTDFVWPVAEAYMCYKHKGARNFWDPDLKRTLIECAGKPITVRDRLMELNADGTYRLKNHLHRREFARTFGRYDRVSLRNPPSAGWQAHPEAADAGWMAIVSTDGEWISGTYWEDVEMLANNAPDFGCIHAGLIVGYDVRPGQTVYKRGAVILGKMDLPRFMACYREDMRSWKRQG